MNYLLTELAGILQKYKAVNFQLAGIKLGQIRVEISRGSNSNPL